MVRHHHAFSDSLPPKNFIHWLRYPSEPISHTAVRPVVALVSFYALPSSPVINLSPWRRRRHPSGAAGSTHYCHRPPGAGHGQGTDRARTGAGTDRARTGHRRGFKRGPRAPVTVRPSVRRELSAACQSVSLFAEVPREWLSHRRPITRHADTVTRSRHVTRRGGQLCASRTWTETR